MKITLWNRLEACNMVRLRCEPDDVCYSHIACDCGDANCTEREHAERDGIWGWISEYTLDDCDCSDTSECRCGAKWHVADSIWGCIGYKDFANERDYSDDLKSECIEALRSALRNRVREPIHRAGLKAGAA